MRYRRLVLHCTLVLAIIYVLLLVFVPPASGEEGTLAIGRQLTIIYPLGPPRVEVTLPEGAFGPTMPIDDPGPKGEPGPPGCNCPCHNANIDAGRCPCIAPRQAPPGLPQNPSINPPAPAFIPLPPPPPPRRCGPIRRFLSRFRCRRV